MHIPKDNRQHQNNDKQPVDEIKSERIALFNEYESRS